MLGELKRKLKPFTMETFKEDARRVYIDTHAAFAKGDLNALRDLVTENIFIVRVSLPLFLLSVLTGALVQDMKKQIEARLENKHTVHWEMNEVPQCAILHMNMVKVLHKSNMFAQITCRFNSAQVYLLLLLRMSQ